MLTSDQQFAAASVACSDFYGAAASWASCQQSQGIAGHECLHLLLLAEYGMYVACL